MAIYSQVTAVSRGDVSFNPHYIVFNFIRMSKYFPVLTAFAGC